MTGTLAIIEQRCQDLNPVSLGNELDLRILGVLVAMPNINKDTMWFAVAGGQSRYLPNAATLEKHLNYLVDQGLISRSKKHNEYMYNLSN